MSSSSNGFFISTSAAAAQEGEVHAAQAAGRQWCEPRQVGVVLLQPRSSAEAKAWLSRSLGQSRRSKRRRVEQREPSERWLHVASFTCENILGGMRAVEVALTVWLGVLGRFGWLVGCFGNRGCGWCMHFLLVAKGDDARQPHGPSWMVSGREVLTAKVPLHAF